MALDFFMNGINTGMIVEPNTQYRELQQAFQNEQWENTTARYEIEEETMIGSFEFKKIEAWIGHVVGMTSTGLKNGDDFRKLIFRTLNHECVRGMYYRFDNNYWIGDFTDEYDSVQKSMSVRRCNNVLRCVDPENGAIFSIPCVVDYDMTSPSQQVSRYIITPNNAAHIMVQGNADTYRLFKLNTRFMLGGRPFKLLAYQNAMMPDMNNPYETLLYFDMYLDELHAKDDIEAGLAYNGTYDYSISIDANNMTLPIGYSGALTASIKLNGKEVARDVVWASSNDTAVMVNKNGSFEVLAESVEPVQIMATIKGSETTAAINITIGQSSGQPEIIVDPEFAKIRQYETIELQVGVFQLGQITYGESTMSLANDLIVLADDYLVITKLDDSKYRLTCNKYSTQPHSIYIQATAEDGQIVNKVLEIRCVSMLG